ncbi:hypothetical protein [Aquimarina longa]|uniref:hypothetical protein n=1 Tax=Aquimarina longa TaxID=1080221 RepID=UPI0007860C38|nr:hypothetical protein [Aquimarina longa]
MKLLTYLKSITEFDLKYGYLIYWYYDYKKDIPYIHKVCTKKIVLDADNEDVFQKSFTSIKKIISAKQEPFAIDKIKPEKCGGCVVNKYCGHKNKKYQEISFPYDTKYLKLYPSEY